MEHLGRVPPLTAVMSPSARGAEIVHHNDMMTASSGPRDRPPVWCATWLDVVSLDSFRRPDGQ
jgi:hypothetical protein